MSYNDLPQNILLGYSSASDWAFTQNMADDGKIGTEQISAQAWKGDWETLTTLTTHDKYGNSSMYVLGCGNSNKTIFIQHISALGALAAETNRKELNARYTSCCSYNASRKTFVFLQSKSDKKWLILPISFDGKIGDSISENKWDTYYEHLFSVEISDIVYLIGHSSDGNRFFIQKISPDGKLGAETTNTKWNKYYDTLIPFKSGNNVYIWGQNKSSKKWFTQKILAGGTLAKEEADNGVWENYYGSATSYIGKENGTETTYFFAQSTDKNKWFTQKIKINGAFENEEKDNGTFHYYYSFLSIIAQPKREPKSAWMSSAYDYLKNKTLKQIIIPGSHDAGMYKTTECSSQGNEARTKTQGSNVYDQLLQGARYFDLRVVAQYKDGGDVEYKIAHVTDVGTIILNFGYQGCLGPSMDEVFNDIVKYAADSQHKFELIILKFSHFMNCCWPGFAQGWNAQRQEDFAQYINKKIGDYLVRYQGDKRIGELTYNEILENGNKSAAKVLVVIDALHDSVRNPSAGLYRYKDYDPKKPIEQDTSKSVDLYVYDKYSSTDDLEKMIETQHQQYVEPKNHGGDMYLLSWTLTHNGVTSSSIEAMAHTANSHLPTSLHEWYKAGEINTAKMPNILYVDYLNELEAETSHTLMEMIYKK